jgi:hypothetical protein
MKRMAWALALWFVAATGLVTADEWTPANGPLLTRWAKDVSPATVHPEYPRPQLVRQDWLNLNGLWQFAEARSGESAPVGRNLAERILVPFPVESALSGVMRRAERVWYRRIFTIPAAWSGRRTLLHFGAVDWETTVWLNGKQLGQHLGGYDAFSFDITDALKNGEQELIIGVWDPSDAGTQPRGKQVRKPQGIYYTPTTGIWQTVWLEPVPETSIRELELIPEVLAGKIGVIVHTAGVTAGDLVHVELAAKGKPVATAEWAAAKKTAKIPLPSPPILWSPEDPFLYDVHVELRRQNKVLDHVDSYCGLRHVSIGKDERGVPRILLNGKFVFQRGPLDQGFWPDGLYTAPTDEALRYDLEITKKLGFNMVRKHVKVEPQRWYYWCDKLGLLVWQDMPSGDQGVAPGKGEIHRSPESARQFELELARMIDGLRNHPSIILWVVFNEGWGQFDTARLTQWVKERDPSRLVDCASGWNDMRVGDVHDIHVYPGPGAPELELGRASVLGEFGGLGLGVDGHTWAKKTWGYRGTKDSADLTRKYERLLRAVYRLKDERGLSAAVYTQITDVETEANGLMTYDRAVIKVDAARAAAANRGDFSQAPPSRVIVPTSQETGLAWRYTTKRPTEGWFQASYDDTSWKEGPGGFGTRGTPGAVVRTEWNTGEIWLRREVILPQGLFPDLCFSLHHDEDAEIYLNGVLAAQVNGYTTDYEEVPLTPEGRKALRPGKNLIAVHCHQTTGGQYIDVGLVEIRR